MTAALKINLGESLSVEDFRFLVELSKKDGKTIDQIVLEAVRESLAARQQKEAA
jgi:hypothetical protein